MKTNPISAIKSFLSEELPFKESTSGNESHQLGDLDAVLAASKWHQVLFENKALRVLKVIVKPGEVVPSSHPSMGTALW